jgi:hypothetical protein
MSVAQQSVGVPAKLCKGKTSNTQPPSQAESTWKRGGDWECQEEAKKNLGGGGGRPIRYWVIQ